MALRDHDLLCAAEHSAPCPLHLRARPNRRIRQIAEAPIELAGMVTLRADPRVNFYSNLPSTPPYQVPVGATVELTFEDVGPGRLIHEWRVVAQWMKSGRLGVGSRPSLARPWAPGC
jgi:hypothetical protein